MTFLKPAPGSDPVSLFHEWFEAAKSSEPSDPDAANLATCAEGKPTSRMVLVRRVDSRGFVFFSNENSRKGQQMAANAHAALCWHWKTLGRQVRVEGRVETVAEAESDAYFASRPRESRIGAWASDQSQPVESRDTLLARVAEMEKTYAVGPVPRPPHWHGFRVVPDRIEFWEQGDFRLHNRFIFTPGAAGGWDIQRLYP